MLLYFVLIFLNVSIIINFSTLAVKVEIIERHVSKSVVGRYFLFVSENELFSSKVKIFSFC